MTAAWDGHSDFYEEDDPVEGLLAVADMGPDAITGQPVSVLDVAESVLERLPGGIDGWKLQKLCYLVQAKHLAQTGLPAFREVVEAWTHGPVVNRLYQEHKGQAWIETVHGDARLAEKDDTVTRVIDQVVREYGEWSGRQLRELTHGQIPWLEARHGLRPNEGSRRPISPGTMREYFELIEELPNDDLEEDSPPF